MKKAVKISLISIVAVVLLAALTFGIIFGWYFPRYSSSKKTFDVSEIALGAELTALSFNLRCIAPGDLFQKSWFYRAELVLDTIASSAPDVIGFQELTPTHEKYLKKALVGYSFALAYRTAKGAKEGVMIAYRSDRFTLLDEGFFWLSETPEKESKSWGTAFPRVAVYVKLKDTVTDKTLSIMDTHLDHVSEEARGKSMLVILDKINELSLESVMLMGDMNDYPDTDMYREAVGGSLVDALEIASTKYVGGGNTYHGFGKIREGKRIDYFFLSADYSVSEYKVIDVTYDGVYPSDHYPIRIKANLN